MALLLFGGALTVNHEGGYVLVDDFLRIRASAPTAVLVKKLRAALEALLADKVIISVAHNSTPALQWDDMKSTHDARCC